MFLPWHLACWLPREKCDFWMDTLGAEWADNYQFGEWWECTHAVINLQEHYNYVCKINLLWLNRINILTFFLTTCPHYGDNFMVIILWCVSINKQCGKHDWFQELHTMSCVHSFSPHDHTMAIITFLIMTILCICKINKQCGKHAPSWATYNVMCVKKLNCH